MPARQPELSGGVSRRPPRTTKTLEPVPSQSMPPVLASSASLAPCWWARASATTFSAYEVVFRPVVAPRSLRVHGTVTTAAVSGRRGVAPTATMSVAAASPRSEPSGATPPV